ncbi:MAG: DUF5011 domain-containing protein [Bacilli bacterium]|nr:DUF5011 domain-containing protein [Bacilli bacterium]
MKRNGFIMSTYVYILLTFFLLLLGTMLLVMNNNRLLSNKLKNDVFESSGINNDEVDFVLLGDAEVNILVGQKYNEPGYSFKTASGKDLTDKVVVNSKVNIYVAGRYLIYYSATYNGKTYKLHRVVQVNENS